MELDILFWLAIGAIYLFQLFAGRKKGPIPGQPPVPAGPTGSRPDRPERRTDRAAGASTRESSSSGSSPSGVTADAAPSLKDALREISDILSGKIPENGPAPERQAAGQSAGQKSERNPDRTGTGISGQQPTLSGRATREYRSPLAKKTESAESRAARLAELRKKHRTHRTRPLGGDRSDSRIFDENAFERRTRPPRSSTYDDLFESPLYEPFGDPIDHKELKVEILEPREPVVEALKKEMQLTTAEARRGIILSEILGPPASRKRRR